MTPSYRLRPVVALIRTRITLIPSAPFISLLSLTLLVCLGMLTVPCPGESQEDIAGLTRDMDTRDGYIPVHYDEETGKLFLEISRLDDDFYYFVSLASGVGSNLVGLDRGQVGSARIGRFQRRGGRIHFVLQNPGFRNGDHANQALTASVEQSFPTSVVAAFPIVVREGGRFLVDATDHFLSDAFDVERRLEESGQGSWRLDRERSSIYLDRTRTFPENTEVEATLTFASERPGGDIARHAPDGRALTLRQHHSFLKPPPPGFEPRRFDPRVGVNSVSFFDFSRSLDERYQVRYITRHRLLKRDPTAERSEPVEPIVYYLDRGVPEPYRTAFEEGARWWNEVFEAAGWIDAFRVEDMPPEMDPLDARYDVIQWVHRTEPGSSWGSSFRDPRTGEILKAAVRMDSHRSLVDYNLYAGARPGAAGGGAPFPGPGSGSGADLRGPAGADLRGPAGALDWVAQLDPAVSAEEFAMARRRQHSAHEVGHTLGFGHNFITQSYGRASVMDYPAPLIRVVDGRIDLSDAYRPGPGSYDTIAIRYAYTQFPEGQEEVGLDAIIQEAMDRDILFVTGADSRPSSSFPEATQWVNGAEALSELERVMDVRRVLIDRFDETAIRPGMPLWRLDERFVPVYLHHRFTLQAAVKAIGGMEFRYALRGDPGEPTRIVSPDRQRRALELVLDAVEPEELAVPERVLRIMAPRPYGYDEERRAFDSKASPAFDQVGIARTLARMVVGGILEPERTARLVAFADRDPELPTLEGVIGRMIERTWGTPSLREHRALRRVVERVVLDELIRLASNEEATVEARAGAEWGLRRIASLAVERAEGGQLAADPSGEAHVRLAASDIQRFLERRAAPVPGLEALAAPPGTPIGQRR